MECINRGFYEKNSKTLIGDYIQNDLRGFTESTANECNENIASNFCKENLIEKYLESVTLQNSKLLVLPSFKTLLRRDHNTMVNSVKLLSGGAAIADPLYSGSVGQGMLTGAIFGEFKKSPPSLNILEVIRVMAQNNKQGVLVIVLNNLANRLNFGSACQRAAREGIKTLLVNVGEDVSGVSVSKTIGRKGLCGIKFLYKIAGAMSEEKKTLYEIYQVIEKLKGNYLGTLNVQIRPDMMVIGPGCIGEPEKLTFLWDTFDDIGENARLTFIVKQALSHLFHPSSYFSLHVVKGDNIVVIVNNLGKLSDFYLSLIIKEVLDQMNTLGFKVMRLYCGRFLNSNLTGFSISVLKVKESVLELLDRPTDVTSWTEESFITTAKPNIILDSPSTGIKSVSTLGEKRTLGPKFTKQEATYLLDVLPKVIETVENMEEYLNKLDNDHDFGTAMNKFANAIKTEIKQKSLKILSPYDFLDQMAYLAGFSMGGVAGGIFTILLSSAAQVFLVAPPMGSVDMGMWVEAARAARDGLQQFTRVRPGDSTILDALDSFVESPTEYSVQGLSKRVAAAMRGAEKTKSSRTSKPKVSIMGDAIDGGEMEGSPMEGSTRTPDPGALCLASVIRTIFTCLQIELAEAEAAAAAAAAEAAAIDARDSKMKVLSKRITILKVKESKLGQELKKDESKHSTELKGKESKSITELNETESKHSTKLIEKESKLDTELKEKESKHEQDLKQKYSKQGEQEGDTIKLGEKPSQYTQSSKEKLSDEVQQLKEVFDDIALEIEDKVPDEQH